MENICLECKYFRQHYIKHGRSYNKISHGHCVFPRLKKKEAGEKACKYFEGK